MSLKFKIPRKLTIKGAHWSIVITRTLKYGEGEILGLCDPSTRTIFIKKGQTERQELATFCHELLHALEFEHEFTLTHKIIEKLEIPLADFIRANLIL